MALSLTSAAFADQDFYAIEEPQSTVVFVGDGPEAPAAGQPTAPAYRTVSTGADLIERACHPSPEQCFNYEPESCDYGYQPACDACGELACECGPPCKPRHHGFFFGEFLYLRPTGGDVTHAQQQDGIGGAGTAPYGRIASIQQDYEPGFRAGMGINLDDCASLTASYTFFESSAADSLIPPVIPGGGGAVRSLVHHPLSTITASVGPVDATQNIDFQLVDVLFHDQLLGCDWCSLGYSLGAVYGNLEQDFAQTGVFSGGAAGTIDTDTMIDFDGGGLKAGLDLERHVGRGIVVYGKVSAAAMSGRVNADYTMVNSTTDVLLAEARWQDNRVISQVEYEIGVRLKTTNDRMRVSAGYQFQHWGNVVTTSDWVDAVRADNYTDLGDTMSFDGLVARVELRY
ncbi:Lpg1974 family pore-forming outer membrane protein [Botrimarina hoheduenensis]|uniref:Uncharacterized protein n=1 Tax=Botrimarina hoheduenensis TaxID=2528000 RepID=A0A5C5VVS7_9BACT|nr:Lpg1974 family pore-forming outer membrane protein [Botrimarina hoheduenensis]TWT41622.1 hypothetical protein Pla111_29990 [Botrimarina hoheduenensis]